MVPARSTRSPSPVSCSGRSRHTRACSPPSTFPHSSRRPVFSTPTPWRVMAADAKRSAGAERRRRAQGVKADGLQAALEALDPAMGQWADEFVFGDVWAGEALGH